MKLSFTVEGKPQPKQRARRGKGGHWYTPSPTVKYEQEVAKAAMVAMSEQGIRKTAFPVQIEVCAYFPDARVRDADNVLKSCQDALNGVVYLDDSQVSDCTARRRIDRKRPRTDVIVWYTDEVD
jgi:Holliday junction resolvase RusA-like endonuclease